MGLFFKKGKDINNNEVAPQEEESHSTDKAFEEAAEKSGRTEADLKAEVAMLEREYGVSCKHYFDKEYYMLPKERMLKRANTVRLRDLYVHKVADETSWSVKEARAAIKEAREKFDITYATYYKQGYFRYSGEEQERFHEERMMRKEHFAEDKVDWAAALSEKTGISKEEAAEKLASVKEEYGILPKLYVNKNYYELPVGVMLSRYLKDRRKEAAMTEMYHVMQELSGKDRKQVREELVSIRELDPETRLNMTWYFRNGAYMLDPAKDQEAIKTLLADTARNRELESSLKESFSKIDRGELAYEDISAEIEEYIALTDKTLSEGRRRQIVAKTGDLLKELDEKERRRLQTDIEVTEKLLGFFPAEYEAFGFKDKSIAERRTYVSSILRWQIIKRLNTEEGRVLLDSKYDTYCRVKPLYKRSATMLEAEGGYEKFLEFAKTHDVFVKKNNYDSLGRGVEKVDLTEGVPLKTVYEELISDSKQIVLEDLISPATEIRELNPDSVNTIRVIVYRDDDGEFKVQDTFAKIGRRGSFVDNGGAGGIFVHVDPETGVFDSHGIDETCTIFETHPDHGYRFEGIAMPHWDLAVETAIEASRMVPEARYIGWDLTCAENGEWIIVEGNSKTQFFAQQMTRGRGIKKEFFEAVNYKGLLTGIEEDEDTIEAEM